MTGSATASSLDMKAANANSPVRSECRRTNALAHNVEANTNNSAVRPLIQSTAMLIPLKFNAQMAAAASAAAVGSKRARARE